MTKQIPQNVQTSEMIALNETLSSKNMFEDTVQAKDSTIYQSQKWEYLVKRQTTNGKEKLLFWFDQLADQGWEIINSQRANLGFYIFKKTSE